MSSYTREQIERANQRATPAPTPNGGGASSRGDDRGQSSFGESLSTMFGAGGASGRSTGGSGRNGKTPSSFKMPEPTKNEPVANYDHFWLMEARVEKPVKVPPTVETGMLPDMIFKVVPRVQHGLSARTEVGPEAGVQPQPRSVKDFASLRYMLVREVPGVIVPPLPAFCAATYYITDADCTEKNGAKLAEFLNRCFAHEDLQTSHTLKVFCLAKPDSWAQVGEYNKKQKSAAEESSSVKMGATYEQMKEFVGIKPDEEHVVESPQDKDVEKQKVWIGVLQAELANCTNAVKTLQTARETAADDVEGLSSDLSHVLEENAKALGLEKDAISAAIGEPKSSPEATNTLAAHINEFAGYAGAAADAIGRREELRLQLQAARTNHASHLKSMQKREEVEKSQAEVSQAKQAMADQGGPAKAGTAASLTQEQKVKIRLVFQQFDVDRANLIDVAELKLAFHVLGKPLSKRDLDGMLKKLHGSKQASVSLDEFMGLAAPHMSASADASEGVLETFSFQLELYYYHLYVMYHHMMKGTMSSPETVDDAAETMEFFEKRFVECDRRLKREMEKFEDYAAEQLRSMSAIFVTLEYKLVAKRKGALKGLGVKLGAAEKMPDDADRRSSAAANPLLMKLSDHLQTAAAPRDDEFLSP